MISSYKKYVELLLEINLGDIMDDASRRSFGGKLPRKEFKVDLKTLNKIERNYVVNLRLPSIHKLSETERNNIINSVEKDESFIKYDTINIMNDPNAEIKVEYDVKHTEDHNMIIRIGYRTHFNKISEFNNFVSETINKLFSEEFGEMVSLSKSKKGVELHLSIYSSKYNLSLAIDMLKSDLKNIYNTKQITIDIGTVIDGIYFGVSKDKQRDEMESIELKEKDIYEVDKVEFFYNIEKQLLNDIKEDVKSKMGKGKIILNKIIDNNPDYLESDNKLNDSFYFKLLKSEYLLEKSKDKLSKVEKLKAQNNLYLDRLKQIREKYTIYLHNSDMEHINNARKKIDDELINEYTKVKGEHNKGKQNYMKRIKK